MANAWGFSWETDDLTESGLGDFRLTSDLVAEGYEAELNAQITDGWRLALNASKIESTLSNIGQTPTPFPEISPTQIDYLLDFDRRLNQTVMGDLRIWGPGGSANARENWSGYADGDLKARLAEQGTVVPENRLWHVNLITNYDFREGTFKGWSVGGAARYQSAATLAYQPIQGDGFIDYDLNSPYKDDSTLNFDLWVSYRTNLFSDRVNWQIQLNIANLGKGDDLIPITVQPDGGAAAFRMQPPQNIFLTNTFSF
jgi:outer membrane receptor for ferric coprogen and ferric-rhodotorulic acid